MPVSAPPGRSIKPIRKGRASRLTEIGGDDGDLGARAMKLRRQSLHRFAAARDEHAVVAVLGGFARELGADATRRTRYERNRAGGTSHDDEPFGDESNRVFQVRGKSRAIARMPTR